MVKAIRVNGKGSDGYCAVYLRRSTDDRQEASITDQLTEITRYVRKDHPDWRITAILTDQESGKNQERPGYLRLMRLMRTPDRPFSRVLVWRTNRFSRAEPLLAMRDLIEVISSGVEIVAVADQLTINTESWNRLQGLLPIVLQASESHEYLRRLSQDTTRGHRSHLQRALRQGGVAPFGYRRAVANNAGELVPGPSGQVPWVLQHGERLALRTHHTKLVLGPGHEVQLVRRIFEMAYQGRTARHIALALNREFARSDHDEKLAPPRYHFDKATGRLSKPIGSYQWTLTTLYSLLRNPAYVGRLAWGREIRPESLRPRWDDRMKQRTSKWTANDGWTVVENAHAPLIPLEWFERVGERRRKSPMAVRSQTHLLVGFGKCMACGSPIWATRKTILRRHSGEEPKKRFFVYLYCSGRDRGIETTCPPILVNHRKALDFLLRQIARMRKHLPTRQKLKAILKERIAKHLAHGREATERRQKEIIQVESEINRLLDQVSKGLLAMSDAFVRKNYEFMKERHETLKNSPARAITAEEIEKVTAQYLEKAEALFDSFETTFKKAPLDLQKALLVQVLERFEVDPAQRKVTFYLYDLPALRVEDGEAVDLKGIGNGSKPVIWEPSLNGTHIKPGQEAAPTKMVE